MKETTGSGATRAEIEAALRGEVFRGARGDLVASYHLDAETPPPLGEIQQAVERRVQVEAQTDRQGAGVLLLAGWRGGWQRDKSGRWDADIFDGQSNMHYRVGRVLVTVRVQRHSGSNWSFKRGTS